MLKYILIGVMLAHPAFAQFAHRSQTGTIIAAGASNCPGIGCVETSAEGSAAAFVTLSSVTGGTYGFMCSNDSWVTTIAVNAYPYTASTGALTSTPVVTATAAGSWLVPLVSCRRFGVYSTVAGTSATVRIDVDPTTYAPTLPATSAPATSSTAGTGVACNSGVSPCTVTNAAQNILNANTSRKACSLQAVGIVDLYCKRATAAGSAASASSFDFLLTAGSGALKGGGAWTCHDAGVVWTGPVNCIASGASAVVDLAVAETN